MVVLLDQCTHSQSLACGMADCGVQRAGRYWLPNLSGVLVWWPLAAGVRMWDRFLHASEPSCMSQKRVITQRCMQGEKAMLAHKHCNMITQPCFNSS